MASSVSGVVDSAKQAASQAASQAKEAAGSALDQAKDQVATRADQQRETVASGIKAVAQAFQSMGDDLKTGEGGPVAEYAAELGQAMGSQVEKLASYLKERDVRQLITDAEDFARRSPAVFLGVSFVLGLAASRFFKSSRPAPEFIANMPDPNRALPPASFPPTAAPPSQASADQSSTAPFWANDSQATAPGATSTNLGPVTGPTGS